MKFLAVKLIGSAICDTRQHTLHNFPDKVTQIQFETMLSFSHSVAPHLSNGM